MTRNLFNQILFLLDVDAPRRDFETHPVVGADELFKAETRQNTHDLRIWNCERSESGNALWPQVHDALWERMRVDVDRILGCYASGKLADQFDAALLRAQNAFAIGAAFEAARCFRIHSQLARRLSDRMRIEVSTLDQHVCSLS